MKKPSLDDYAISDETLAWSKRLRSRLIVGAIVLSVAAVGAGIAFESAWLVIAGAPPYSPLILYFVARSGARAVSSAFRSALEFEEAVDRYEQWWVRTQLAFWQSLGGRPFEVELAMLFSRSGCEVELTPASDDQGVDIWVTRADARQPVQCKAHRRPIGPGAIREFYGTMQHFGCAAGTVASISGFTGGATAYAEGKNIELLDLAGILAMQKRLR